MATQRNSHNSFRERLLDNLGLLNATALDQALALLTLSFQAASAWTTQAGAYAFLPNGAFAWLLGIGMQAILLGAAEKLRALLSETGQAEYKRTTVVTLILALLISWFFSSTEFFHNDGYQIALERNDAQANLTALSQAQRQFANNRKLMLDELNQRVAELQEQRSGKLEVTRNAASKTRARQTAALKAQTLDEKIKTLQSNAAQIAALGFPEANELRATQAPVKQPELSNRQAELLRRQLKEAQQRQDKMLPWALPETATQIQPLPSPAEQVILGVTALFVRELWQLQPEAIKPAVFGLFLDGFTLLLIFMRVPGGVQAVRAEVRRKRQARLDRVRYPGGRAPQLQTMLTFVIRQPVTDRLQVPFIFPSDRITCAEVYDALPHLSTILSQQHRRAIRLTQAFSPRGAELDAHDLLSVQLDEDWTIYLNDPPELDEFPQTLTEDDDEI